METFVLVIIPIVLGYNLAKKRKRNVLAGMFVCWTLGWIGFYLLVMFLKTREVKGGAYID